MGMKTAISVEDSLMREADEAARGLGLSRSGLVAEALRDYLRRLREKQITEQLDRVYAEPPTPDERRLVRQFRDKLPVVDKW
jgi:metal-responsive CopG/Arc/MetJ family transcriptional regulator